MLLSAACSPSLLSPCMAAPSVRAMAGSCAEQVTPVPHNVPVKLALTRQAWQQRWNMLSRALPWSSQALLPAVSSGRAGQTRCSWLGTTSRLAGLFLCPPGRAAVSLLQARGSLRGRTQLPGVCGVRLGTATLLRR